MTRLPGMWAAAVALTGCIASAPPYSFVQKSAKDPIAGATKLAVRPPAFSPAFTVNNDPEAAFIKDLDEKQKADWATLKTSLAPHVTEGIGDVRGSSGGNPPLIVSGEAFDRVLEPELQSVDYNYCRWKVTVKDGAGAALEVFSFSSATKKGMGDYTVWQALPVCSWSLGAIAARYVGGRGNQP